MKLWTMRSALELIRDVDSRLRQVGYFAALTGGVLIRGWSRHDLDVIVTPLKKSRQPRRMMRQALTDAGLRLVISRPEVVRSWRERGIRDTKWVEIWYTSDHRRVDIMLLN